MSTITQKVCPDAPFLKRTIEYNITDGDVCLKLDFYNCNGRYGRKIKYSDGGGSCGGGSCCKLPKKLVR